MNGIGYLNTGNWRVVNPVVHIEEMKYEEWT